jgi:hypothetical protein
MPQLDRLPLVRGQLGERVSQADQLLLLHYLLQRRRLFGRQQCLQPS